MGFSTGTSRMMIGDPTSPDGGLTDIGEIYIQFVAPHGIVIRDAQRKRLQFLAAHLDDPTCDPTIVWNSIDRVLDDVIKQNPGFHRLP